MREGGIGATMTALQHWMNPLSWQNLPRANWTSLWLLCDIKTLQSSLNWPKDLFPSLTVLGSSHRFSVIPIQRDIVLLKNRPSSNTDLLPHQTNGRRHIAKWSHRLTMIPKSVSRKQLWDFRMYYNFVADAAVQEDLEESCWLEPTDFRTFRDNPTLSTKVLYYTWFVVCTALISLQYPKAPVH